MKRWWKWSEKAGVAQPAAALLLTMSAAAACGGDPPAAGDADGAPAATASAGARAPKVLLIGIDGVRFDVLAEVPTPNIDALVADGAFTTETTTTTPSVSGPSWSSMLTGVWPEKHGVTSNDFVAPRYDEHPDFLSRVEEARPELVTFAVADWPPLMELQDRPALLGPAIDVRVALDGYDVGWAEADSLSVDAAVDRLEEADVDALFVYLGNPDETSHATGSIGQEYRAAIATADDQVGRLVEAVRTRPAYSSEDWLVLISTDHGRRPDGGHGGDSPEEMTTFIVVSGAAADTMIAAPTYIVDVAATALVHMGVAADGLDGAPVGLRRR